MSGHSSSPAFYTLHKIQHIRCGHGIVGIPQNTCDALLHLSFDDRPRLLWVDYLCIKQDDDQEKSHQVRMLHKIYAQAHVVSWLGTGYGVDLECVSFYFPLLAHFWITALRTNRRLCWRELWSLAVKRFEEYLVGQATVDHPPFSWGMLISALATGYFDRIWTVQEVILGKTNTFQIGNALFSVAVLAAAVRMLHGLHDHPLSTSGPISNKALAGQLEAIEHNYLVPALHKHFLANTVSSSHDLDIVTFFSKASCSDPRDRIYGLVSLFEDSNAYDVDYTLSVSEVFADFTIHCLLSAEGISVLNRDRWAMREAYEPNGEFATLCSSLPSWCPNWENIAHDPVFHDDTSKHCAWRACGQHDLVHSRPTRVTLKVRGLAVSRLRVCNSTTFWWMECWDEQYKDLVWSEESLCSFFEFPGLHANSISKDLILRVLEHVLVPAVVNGPGYYNSTGIDFQTPPIPMSAKRRKGMLSNEMRSLFEQVSPRDHLRSLLAPVYLAKVDPKLFTMAGLKVDARLPPNDFPTIEFMVSQWLAYNSIDTRLFATEGGMIGTGYPGIEEGDMVCILYGSDTPQILRQIDDDSRFILVGACNVDGLMFGEGLEMGLIERDFILV